MSDNNENVDQDKTPEGPLQTDHGTTTIEENVVAKIAGMAARQVPGVYGMGNAVRRAFSAVTDRIPTTQTNVTGGITVHKGETQTAIDVIVVVEYGYSIINVCNDIRSNIIDQIEGTTGLEVVASDPPVRALLGHVFGGITSCDTVAQGIVAAVESPGGLPKPVVVRLDGNNVAGGRRILSEANHPLVVLAETMDSGADKAAELAHKA